MDKNANPYDGEAYFNLGLCLRHLGRNEEAYAAFHNSAEPDCQRGAWPAALAHLDCSLRANSDHLEARNQKALVLRQLNREKDAAELLRDSWYGQTGWRWMFALTAIPSLLFFIGLFFTPESPRWLAKKGMAAQAAAILEKIGGKHYASAAVEEIRSSLAGETKLVDFTELLDPKLLKIMVLGIGLAVFQQWCGINVIFNYAPEIFKQAGYDISDVLKNIAWTGSVNLVFTLVSLGMVDRFGRRPLMLFGSAALAVIYAVLAACYRAHLTGGPMLALVLAAIACYAMSLAPVTWVVIAEIFPNRIRGAAMSVAVAALWLACFLLIFTFPKLNAVLGASGSFFLYAAICVAGFVFVFFKLPENKGKALEQIEKELTE